MAKSKLTGPVKTAIAGLGRAGWGIHARILKTRQDFQLVAVIDPEAERRAEAERDFPGCKGYADWKKFLDDPNGAELVIVATASIAHVPMSIDALKKGFHVMTEKPMATNLKDADKVLKVAKKAKGLFTVHQNHREDADLHHLLSIFDSGLLGRVFYIRMFSAGFRRRNDWQTLRKFGGGTLNNTCPHNIDECLQLLQSPVVDVWGDLQQAVSAGDTEDHVQVMMRGKNGRVIEILVTSACAISQPHWLVMGTKGTLVSEGKEFYIKHLDPAKPLSKLKVNATLAVPGRKYGVVGGEELSFLEKRVPAAPPEMAKNLYSELYRSIREGKKAWITPESVREQIRVIAMARKGTKFPG